tara:strand:+ start:623 stop:1087 length:465 start_codon:yes stop_codon:yes gene_type:complete
LDLIISLIEKIKRRNLTIAVAESCTGGKVASTIVSNEGVSNIFLGGVVTYSDNSKVEILKIDKNKIQNYGAVSSEIAKDMSIGVKKLFNSDISISTTGNVGPKLGDKSSSLGKVFIAINFNNKVIVEEYNFDDDRNANISNAVFHAFSLLNNIL